MKICFVKNDHLLFWAVGQAPSHEVPRSHRTKIFISPAQINIYTFTQLVSFWFSQVNPDQWWISVVIYSHISNWHTINRPMTYDCGWSEFPHPEKNKTKKAVQQVAYSMTVSTSISCPAHNAFSCCSIVGVIGRQCFPVDCGLERWIPLWTRERFGIAMKSANIWWKLGKFYLFLMLIQNLLSVLYMNIMTVTQVVDY